MAAWIKEAGALPDITELKADLCQTTYDYDAAGRLRLEPKEKLKARTGKSPDLADALALTFAAPVRPAGHSFGCEFARSEYDVV
ncbi:MAG: hypothetical protein IKO35_03785 [Elusimicrobiaceae bacterium]|nr:hypothetical protein [Elusimicrobiaceae bacterium]